MITVRFATGLAVQFTRANVAVETEHGHNLFTKYGDEGVHIAAVPKDCIIEFEPADIVTRT